MIWHSGDRKVQLGTRAGKPCGEPGKAIRGSAVMDILSTAQYIGVCVCVYVYLCVYFLINPTVLEE